MSDALVVLVADDDKDAAHLTRLALKKSDLNVVPRFVPDGQAAIDYLEGRGEYADRKQFPLPHYALLDLRMPVKTGLEVLEWLRQKPEFQELPVMLLTATAEERYRQRAEELTVNAFRERPASFTDLVTTFKDFFRDW